MDETDDYHNKLERLRKEIDNIDNEIVELLNKRGEIVIKVGRLKNELKLEIKQPIREKRLVERIEAKSKNYNKKDIQAIWKEIIKASRKLQNKVLKNNKVSSSDSKMKKSLKN